MWQTKRPRATLKSDAYFEIVMAAGAFDCMLSCFSGQAEHSTAVGAFAETVCFDFFDSANCQNTICFNGIPNLQKLFVFPASCVNIAGKYSVNHKNQHSPHQHVNYKRLNRSIYKKQYKIQSDKTKIELIYPVSAVHKTCYSVFEICHITHSFSRIRF
jgi:hypothetical protein